MRPNFFIVGAPKAGTTSLCHYLDQHPRVFLSPVKEACYFASEVRPENFAEEYKRYIVLNTEGSGGRRFSALTDEWEAYLNLFEGATDQTAIGEAGVCYLWSPTAPRNIRSRIPDAGIVAVLRHPAERAWSQYLHAVANGHIRKSFRECLQACLKSRETQFSPTYPFLEFGLYYEQIRRYLDLFPRENVGIWFYQDGLASIVADIFRFLKVPPDFHADISRRHLEAAGADVGNALFRVLRSHNLWQPLRKVAPAALRPAFRRLAFRKRGHTVMPEEDRRFLCDYYKEDVMRLAALLNRDLTSWLV